MSEQYRLLGLGNSELLARLSALVKQGNALTARLLAHLVELEERLLHLERGFSSLFSYCVEALGMSEGAAGRRVTAARVCRRFPEAFQHIARGDLHLCALCALAPHLTAENASDFFAACRGKSRRQIEELLAARFPRPDVREQIRRLPARAQVPSLAPQTRAPSPTVEASAALTQQPTIVLGIPAISANPPAAPIATTAPNRPRTREIEPLAADRFGVHFTADTELRELIERARALASHRIPNGDLASLMKLMVTNFVQQEEKRRFGTRATQRRTKQEHTNTNTNTSITDPARGAPPGEASASPGASKPPKLLSGHREPNCTAQLGKRGRYLPVKLRRETHQRDCGRCAFVSADGRRCNARAFVQFDHIKPFARHGGADARNIRLLCRAHNLLHARHCFGARHVAAKIEAKKRLDPRGNAEV